MSVTQWNEFSGEPELAGVALVERDRAGLRCLARLRARRIR